MKWIIIISLISLPIMFFLPLGDFNVSEEDYQTAMAEIQFSDACGNAILQGCPLDAFNSTYAQCTKVYGNISLEQCRSNCCTPNQTAQYFVNPFPIPQ